MSEDLRDKKQPNGDRRATVRVMVRAGFVFLALVVYMSLTLSFMHVDRELVGCGDPDHRWPDYCGRDVARPSGQLLFPRVG